MERPFHTWMCRKTGAVHIVNRPGKQAPSAETGDVAKQGRRPARGLHHNFLQCSMNPWNGVIGTVDSDWAVLDGLFGPSPRGYPHIASTIALTKDI